MQVMPTKIEGLIVITPQLFEDSRGWFVETYAQTKLQTHGIDAVFVQDNHSLSIKKGTLRGLHFQKPPQAQAKLVRCTKGAIWDVGVDIRQGSPTYGQWVRVELSAANHKQFFIPKGFAHGFITLVDDTEVQYKVDADYAPECEGSIRFDDPQLGIDWGSENPILSQKDKAAPLLKQSDCGFIYGKE